MRATCPPLQEAQTARRKFPLQNVRREFHRALPPMIDTQQHTPGQCDAFALEQAFENYAVTFSRRMRAISSALLRQTVSLLTVGFRHEPLQT